MLVKLFSRRNAVAVVMLASVLGLSACGGGGGSSGDDSDRPPPSKLFVADAGNRAIGSFANPMPAAGSIAVDRIIVGNQTTLNSYLSALALDAGSDRLYVGNGTVILAFEGASTAEGDVSPVRVGTEGGASGIESLQLDKANDVLYVGTGSGLLAFNSVSSSRNAAPSRALTGNFFHAYGASVDTGRNIAYLLTAESQESSAQFGTYSVRVYDNAATLIGDIPPSRVIRLDTQITDCGLLLDAANDRLYVSTAAGRIYVYEQASTRNGAANPDRVIMLPANSYRLALNVASDVLYAVSNQALYVVSNASTSNGSVTAVAVQRPEGGNLQAVAVAP